MDHVMLRFSVIVPNPTEVRAAGFLHVSTVSGNVNVSDNIMFNLHDGSLKIMGYATGL